MKTKLTLLAAVILAGIGSTVALAGLDSASPAADKPAGMSCCAKSPKVAAATADKEAPAPTGMSCHTDKQAAKDSAPVQSKGCCKK